MTLSAFMAQRGAGMQDGPQHVAAILSGQQCNIAAAVQKLTDEEAREQALRERAASERGASIWNQVHPSMHLHGSRTTQRAYSVLKELYAAGRHL
jgi:hypothetical protein